MGGEIVKIKDDSLIIYVCTEKLIHKFAQLIRGNWLGVAVSHVYRFQILLELLPRVPCLEHEFGLAQVDVLLVLNRQISVLHAELLNDLEAILVWHLHVEENDCHWLEHLAGGRLCCGGVNFIQGCFDKIDSDIDCLLSGAGKLAVVDQTDLDHVLLVDFKNYWRVVCYYYDFLIILWVYFVLWRETHEVTICIGAKLKGTRLVSVVLLIVLIFNAAKTNLIVKVNLLK